VTPVLTWLILKTICSIASAVRQGDQWVSGQSLHSVDSKELGLVMRYKWRQDRPNEKPTGKARVEEIHQDRADG